MSSRLINLRIPSAILSETVRAVRLEGYTNTQDFIREALREKLERRRRIKENLAELHKLCGSAKNPRILSKKKLNELIMKEYGI